MCKMSLQNVFGKLLRWLQCASWGQTKGNSFKLLPFIVWYQTHEKKNENA